MSEGSEAGPSGSGGSQDQNLEGRCILDWTEEETHTWLSNNYSGVVNALDPIRGRDLASLSSANMQELAVGKRDRILLFQRISTLLREQNEDGLLPDKKFRSSMTTRGTPVQSAPANISDVKTEWNKKNILDRVPENLPEYGDLSEFLKEDLMVPLPVRVADSDYEGIVTRNYNQWHSVVSPSVEVFLQTSFSAQSKTENWWQSAWAPIIDAVWGAHFCKFILGLDYNRNSMDSTMTVESRTGTPLRPDFAVVTSKNFMIFKGEEKPDGNSDAAQELVTKMQGIGIPAFGPMRYLLAYATEGSKISIYAITPEQTEHGQLPNPLFVFDCSDALPVNRARLFRTFVNTARLLCCVRNHVQNIGWMGRGEIRRNRCTLHAKGGKVEKKFNDVKADRERMYLSLRGHNCPHLICPISVTDRAVVLRPLGYSVDKIPPHAQLYYVMCVLRACAFLHNKDLCHNDIRSENVVCVSTDMKEWVLIDLEICQPVGTDLPPDLSPNHPLRSESISTYVGDLNMLLRIVRSSAFENCEVKDRLGQLIESDVSGGFSATEIINDIEAIKVELED